HAIPLAVRHGLLPPSTPNPGPALLGSAPHPLVVKLSKDPKFVKLVLDEMNKTGKEAKLRGFEFARAIHVEPEMFSLQNGLLTPTFKLKRNEAVKHYREIIDELYKQVNSAKEGSKL
ncbi:eukaryotic long-chain fatty acid CoA synthetase (LC-FACS), partial [Chytridiales sp. JEL 0842]